MNTAVSYAQDTKPKLLWFISMLVIVLLCAGTTLGFRLVEIGPFTIPGSTTIYPFTYFVYALITDVYGYKETRKLIWLAILFNFIFSILIFVGNHMPAPTFWDGREAFDAVYSNVLLFTTGGSIGMAVSEFLNSYLVAKWKVILKGRVFVSSFPVRALVASFIGEAAHVVIFGSVVCYFTLPLEYGVWVHTLLSTYLYRIAYGIVVVVPVAIVGYFIKKYEGMDVYDTDTNFNPFNIKE